MEAAAPYAAAPRGPRNLTVLLAAWLRRMGFTVTEQGDPAPTALSATWQALGGEVFALHYAHAAEDGALLHLTRRLPGEAADVGLVYLAEVNRLREARFLLLSNAFYAAARRAALAAGALRPAPLTPAD